MAITLRNASTSTVSLFVPAIKMNRELIPGRRVPITQEEYEELTFDPGFMALVRGHYIVIEGVEKEQAVEEVGQVFDQREIERMLLTNDITGFAKFIPHATAAEKESVVTLAIQHKITNNAIVALIKKYCDVDIISAISVAHEAEEK